MLLAAASFLSPLLTVLAVPQCLHVHASLRVDVLPSELVNAHGQLIAKVIKVEPAPTRLRPFKHPYAPSLEGLNLPQVFWAMVDFPVYVWRDMLVDFRAYVVEQAFPNASERAALGATELTRFWHAFKALHERGWFAADYDNLLHFAYHSSKWHERYDWQLVDGGSHAKPVLITSHASHYRGLGCRVPAEDKAVSRSEPVARANETVTALFYPTARQPHEDGAMKLPAS